MSRYNHLETAIAAHEADELARTEALVAEYEYQLWIEKQPAIKCRGCDSPMADIGEAYCPGCLGSDDPPAQRPTHCTECGDALAADNLYGSWCPGCTDEWCPF